MACSQPIACGGPVVVDSGAISLVGEDEVVVASEPGHYASCDVWVDVPSEWGDVTMRLYARLKAARVLLREIRMDGIVPLDGDQYVGLGASVRGRPCDAFEVTCEAPDLESRPPGRVYMQLLSAAGATSAITREPGASPSPAPLVAAALVARDAATGAFVPVSTDPTGRLLMANPLFTEDDRTMLDAATASATADTLVARDADAGTTLSRVRLVEEEAPDPESATAILYAADGRARAVDPNGVTTDMSWGAVSADGDTKAVRKYAAKVQTVSADGTGFIALVSMPSVAFPAGDCSGIAHFQVHGITDPTDTKDLVGAYRVALWKRIGGTLSITGPTEQEVGPTNNGGGLMAYSGPSSGADAFVGADSGDLTCFIHLAKTQTTHWMAWLEVRIMEH